ncbi:MULTISPECIES: tetratricopeptide repeat protein [Sorangium]|uniref:Tetratricopeptide repeat protein n=1 Tax=Sorangium cellulosum TaxID=56 RepID=A0A4P2QYF7_SORCE|nr:MULTISPECIES: tetratricopeptide repeat protein [Sorangium]AUX35624.1 hypothetical protein SOCE836_078190 [Sorangium cellulosum]WCQ94924.1 hypothetical protein NQZ70_07697 [Sorangium sp. Soce836]
MDGIDPNNPVVRLCAEGMQAEAEGRNEDARVLFERAWAARTDDYEACIAAHYVARHQGSDKETLAWNQEALRRTDAVGGDRARGFYPSLLLNLGHSHEVLGDMAEARACYERAAALLHELPAGPYGDMVRNAVKRARGRVE